MMGRAARLRLVLDGELVGQHPSRADGHRQVEEEGVGRRDGAVVNHALHGALQRHHHVGRELAVRPEHGHARARRSAARVRHAHLPRYSRDAGEMQGRCRGDAGEMRR